METSVTPRARTAAVPFLVAYAVSMLGDRFAEVALPIAILAITGEPVAAGLVTAGIQLPGLVLVPSMGFWTDRYSRRRLLVTADALRAVGFAAFALLATQSAGGLLLYLLLGVTVGCGNVLFGLASQAVLPQLVEGTALGRTNALLETGDSITTIGGPALAGITVARLGAAWGLVVNAGSFVVSGLLLRFFLPSLNPTPDAEGSAAGARGLRRVLRQHVAEPVALVLHDRFQRTLQLGVMALSAHGVSLALAVVVLGRSSLGLSVAQIGFVLSAAGVGGLIASLLAARFAAPFDTMGMVAASLLASAGAATALALAPAFWWALAANGVLDGFVTAAFITTATTRQARTPHTVLGRVGAVAALTNNLARIVGVTGMGIILSAAGGRWGLVADAVVLALAGLTVLRSARDGRNSGEPDSAHFPR
jgi:predicted MFS family arabinose efflux permease